MVAVERRGRRNTYALNPDARLRHPTLKHVPLSRIVAAVAPELAAAAGGPARDAVQMGR